MGIISGITGAISGGIQGLTGGGSGGGGGQSASFDEAFDRLQSINDQAITRSVDVSAEQTESKTAVDAGKAARVA
ncbi:MAG: hypothetical protein ACR2RA_19980 [Geminicoccaceae bacterium]